MDIIFIRDLRVDAIIGINDWERRIRQTLSISLEMGGDICRAAVNDAIEDTLDYKAVAKRVMSFVEASQFYLVETLAQRLAELLIDEFKLPWVKLTICKPGAVRGSREVGVVIERGSTVKHG